MNTKQYLTDIKNHLEDISSILEIQCGDKYDIENCIALQDPNLKYFGIDVIDKNISDNRQYFREEKNKIFITLDASNEPLPKADLISCVGMSPYLPIANIWSLLENIRESEAKYFIFDHYILDNNEKINANISIQEDHQKRSINLGAFPFYFPNPILSVAITDNHHAALFDISQVGFFMDVISDRFSRLRRDIFNVMEYCFDNLEKAFLQKDCGELLKEVALGFLDLNDQQHKERYFLNNPYRTIFNENSLYLESRNNIFRLVYFHNPEIIAKQYEIEIDDIVRFTIKIIATDYIRWKFNKSFFF